jgi:hypothetical protein
LASQRRTRFLPIPPLRSNTAMGSMANTFGDNVIRLSPKRDAAVMKVDSEFAVIIVN